MAEQRLWWIKLSDRFMTSETVDFLMSQKDGANYVVLYQMLCLKTINTDGELSRQIGEIIVEFDVNKIQRDCKWFSIDTIRIALTLYQQLGLIYRQENGILRIADFDRLVGSETSDAERKRRERAQKAIESADIVRTLSEKCHDRERYKDKEEKEMCIKKKTDTSPSAIATHTTKRFVKPTLEEVQNYCKERNNRVNPERFMAYYESKGWTVGKDSPMKDWKACVRTWELLDAQPQARDYDVRKHDSTDFKPTAIDDLNFGEI